MANIPTVLFELNEWIQGYSEWTVLLYTITTNLEIKKVGIYGKKESIIYDFILELEKIITEVLLKDTEEEWKTEEVVFDQRIIDYLLPD